MKFKIIIWIVGMILLISLVSAEDLVFKKESVVDIKLGCSTAINTGCDGTQGCSITIIYPNETTWIAGGKMSPNINFYNYTLPSSDTTGEYKTWINCSDSKSAGFTNFNFYINEQGSNPTQAQSIIYFVILAIVMVIIILCCVGMFATQNEYFKISLFGIGYLFLVWLFAIIQDISSAFLYYSFLNRFATIIFKILMMGIYPIIIYVLAMIIYKVVTDKQIAQLAKRGIKK